MTLRFALILSAGLAASACSPKSKYHDYTSPERAARSFVEAGRIGDSASVRSSLVAEEEDDQLDIDYRDLGDYSLALDRRIDDAHAIVMMQAGTVRSPLACRREADGWKVSIRASLRCMQEMQPWLLSSAGR